MASKLLNVRMDEEMLKDLKEVCGELGINVTDAIKSFSKELIEKKKLPTEKVEEKKETSWRDIINDDFFETCGHAKEYEEMLEQISDIILSCNKDLRTFILKKWSEYRNSYQELTEEFKNEYGEEFKNKILDIITNFYEFHFKDVENSYGFQIDDQEKFQQEKYISAMENIKRKNPELYKELLDEYTYNLNFTEMYCFDTNGYFETKKMLEKILTKEEINEYVKYSKEIHSCRTEQEKEEFRNSISQERINILNPIFDKIRNYQEPIIKKDKNEVETCNYIPEKEEVLSNGEIIVQPEEFL